MHLDNRPEYAGNQARLKVQRIASRPDQFLVPLQAGYLVQPQNCFPALRPLRAVLRTIEAPQLGHLIDEEELGMIAKAFLLELGVADRFA